MIPHLFFAYDCLIFFVISENSGRILKQILKDYKKISGQNISYEKSKIDFNKRAGDDDEMCDIIQNILHVKVFMKHSKYLGLPMTVANQRVTKFFISY